MNTLNFQIIGHLFIYLFPISFLIVVAKKLLNKEEINFLDLLLAIYTNIWIIILTTIGFYLFKYYRYAKELLGLKGEYLWILVFIVVILAFYNFYLSWKISASKKRRLDKW